MSRYSTELAAVCALLNGHEARYVLFGARAMQLWGTTRATRDVDILIEPRVENARLVLDALSNLGSGLAGEWLGEELSTGPVTVVGDSPRVNVFTVMWSVHYPEAAADAR